MTHIPGILVIKVWIHHTPSKVNGKRIKEKSKQSKKQRPTSQSSGSIYWQKPDTLHRSEQQSLSRTHGLLVKAHADLLIEFIGGSERQFISSHRHRKLGSAMHPASVVSSQHSPCHGL